MKQIVTILIAIFLIGSVANAQSVVPRFGISGNVNNTGLGLTYKYLTVIDAAGDDGITPATNAWQTNYRIVLTDSFSLRQPTITKAFSGDNIRVLASGAAGTKVKFTGSNFVSSGSCTLSTGGYAIIEFIFIGTKWVECSRNIL